MSANNYTSNVDHRLPTRVTRALGEYLGGIEPEAALVARRSPAQGDLGEHFSQFLRLVEQARPRQVETVRQRMGAAVDNIASAPHLAPYRGGQLRPGEVLARANLVARHKPALTELASTWVHIPPEVTGAHLFEPPISRTSDDLVTPQAPYNGLRFHLARVKCFDETGGPVTEWLGGTDEIYCGAVAVDENGTTSSGGLFKVRNFDDGDVRDYGHPGKSLQFFNIREGGNTFPKIYTMAVSLVEHDFGDLPDWFNHLLDLVRQKVIEYLAALVGATIGTSLGPLGALIGAAIGWAVGKVISLVKSWLGDENLGTKMITATVNGYSGKWVDSGSAISSMYTRDYKAHKGHYRLYWRCEFVA